jgi:hypothetical protein
MKVVESAASVVGIKKKMPLAGGSKVAVNK